MHADGALHQVPMLLHHNKNKQISQYQYISKFKSKLEYSKLMIDHKKSYILEYICVDNILCSFSCWVNIFVWFGQELCSFTWNSSWQCNVQLPVREHRFRKIYSNIWDSLPLDFVNSHDKTESNWELFSFELERKCNILRRA